MTLTNFPMLARALCAGKAFVARVSNNIYGFHNPHTILNKKRLSENNCKSFFFCGPAKNRTWILSFGNSRTIHCTTRPFCYSLLRYCVIALFSYTLFR